MVDIITYDSFPIRGKVVDLEAIETASGKAEQAVETANQAVTTAQAAMSEAEDARDFVQGITSELAPAIKSDALSGSIVEFDNGAKYWPVNSMVVDVQGYQEGSGDPSPTNVRAIHGWTGANVTRSGFNVWDEEWELGNISGINGDKEAGAYLIPKNYIPVIPSMEYCISSPNEQGTSGRKWVVYFYDANKNFISYNGTLTSLIQVFSVPSNCYYIKFRNNKTSTTYDNDICINLSNPLHNGEYAPAEVETFPITFPSEAGTVYKGELDVTRGKLRVDWAVVDLGTLNWTVFAVPGTEYSAFRAAMPTNSIDTIASGRSAVCEKYVVISPRAMAYQNMPDKSVDVCDGNLSASKYVLIRDDSYTDAATFKAEMDGVLMAYGLQTPQEYDLTPTEVTTILGQNYIWADCGDVKELILTQDTKEYVDRRLDTNGYYDGLTVGLSEQLLSKNRVVDQTPYLYRQTALGKANATRAFMKKIVGGSVVWNQLVQNGDFSNGTTGWTVSGGSATVSNGTVTLTKNASSGTFPFYQNVQSKQEGHKVLIRLDAYSSAQISYNIYWGSQVAPSITITTTKQAYAIVGIVGSGNNNFNLQGVNVPASGTVSFSNIQLFDLTAMFGSTIADYIYSLKTVTEGSGIAWLKEHFPKMFSQYNAYDPGTIRSVEGVSAKETVGKNYWNVVTGRYIDGNGNFTEIGSNAHWTSAEAIPVFGANSFTFTLFENPSYINGSITYIAYDENMHYVATAVLVTPSSSTVYPYKATINLPSNARYIYLRGYRSTTAGGVAPILNVVAQFERGSVSTFYEPYSKHTYPLDSTKEWRGIFKLDENNNLYADGDIYPPSGEASRRYALVDLGTLNWNYGKPFGGDNYFCWSTGLANIAKFVTASEIANVLTTKFVTVSANIMNNQYSSYNKTISLYNKWIVVHDDDYTDAATFKTAMSGVYLVYELATPTTETAEPYTEVQIVDKDGTEEFVTSGIVPVGHVTEYPEDLVGKIDELPDLPETAGSYVLRVTVTSGKASYEWVSAS